MVKVISKEEAYASIHNGIKLCPKCYSTLKYSQEDVKTDQVSLSHSVNYITCPNCQHEITVGFISTEHM